MIKFFDNISKILEDNIITENEIELIQIKKNLQIHYPKKANVK